MYFNRGLAIIPRFRKYSKGPSNFNEWKLPVPWGQISGKWWGDKNTVPLLAIHNYRENAAAFDNLIPKLSVPSVLALDLPGHGQSSPFPKGRYMTLVEFLVTLRHVTLKLPPGQVSIVAHGLSSFFAFVFAASYFKQVESLISIECGRHTITEVVLCRPQILADVTDRFFEIENSPIVFYTEPELLNILKNTGPMSDEAARILLGRSSKPHDNKLIFTNDPRNEIFPLSGLTDEDILAIAGNMVCKMVEIRNTADNDLIQYEPGEITTPGLLDSNLQQLIRRKGPENIKKLHEESWKILRASCRQLLVHHVKSSQHILLDESEKTAQLINGFFSTDFEEHRIMRR